MKASQLIFLLFSVAWVMPTPLFASEHESSDAVPGAQRVQRIAIENFTFVPATLEVAVGARVSWVNEDDVPHVVIGTDPGSPVKSGALDTDDSYSVELDHPGTYRYFCSLHPHMTGTVIVK
jgi:plastocyanin